jgi:hypothetical protein
MPKIEYYRPTKRTTVVNLNPLEKHVHGRVCYPAGEPMKIEPGLMIHGSLL